MSPYRLFIFLTAVLFLISNASANHVRKGNVKIDSEMDVFEGKRKYVQEAKLSKAVVCYEDLMADGVTIAMCGSRLIKFRGATIDMEDFEEDYVISFRTEDYKAAGCPMPPLPEGEEDREPEYVFRNIRSAKPGHETVLISSVFMDVGQVVPEIVVKFGDIVKKLPGENWSSHNHSERSLATSSRRSVGINHGFSQSISAAVGLHIDWQMTAKGGVDNFHFDLFHRRVTWVQKYHVESVITTHFSKQLTLTLTKTIFEQAVPAAGFSFHIFWVGGVHAGFTAAVDVVSEIQVGGAVSLTVSGGIHKSQMMHLGLTDFYRTDLPDGPTRSPELRHVHFSTEASVDSFYVNGFCGIRPELRFGISVPFIGGAQIGLGAEVGLNTRIGYKNPPYGPAGGITFGVCSSCHFVEGNVHFAGRRFSVKARAAFLTKEYVIVDQIFNKHIATYCFAEASC